MSDYHDVVRQGYLKIKSKNLGVWQKRWFILRRASSKGGNRLERFSDEKASMISYDAKTMDLAFVERVDRYPSENRHHVIVLWFIDGGFKQLSASSELEASEWATALEECSGTNHNNNDFSMTRDSIRMLPRDMFHVYLLPNTMTSYSGEYVMQVTAESVNIRDPNYEQQVLVNWKLNTLRRYGKDGDKFSFESGRSSDTGEGLFIFTSVDCDRIYQMVHTATQALVTVKSMSRRQQEASGGLSDGSVLSFTKTVPAPTVDTQEMPPKVEPRHDLIALGARPSLSKRSVPEPEIYYDQSSEAEDEPPDGIDNNNMPAMYSMVNENRTPQFSLTATGVRPDGTPFSTSYGNGMADEREYIYEEKGLTDDFRRFLAGRKDDDDS